MSFSCIIMLSDKIRLLYPRIFFEVHYKLN